MEEFYKQFDGEQLARIQTVAMDMWEPYIRVSTQYVPQAQEKIAFDKFLPDTLGTPLPGADEHRRLAGEDDRLKSTDG